MSFICSSCGLVSVLTLQSVICFLAVFGQYFGDPYSSSVNRYGYRYGSTPNYGTKYGYPYNNGQYYDPNRNMLASSDPLTEANNYWRHYRERYPPQPSKTYGPSALGPPGGPFNVYSSGYMPSAYPPSAPGSSLSQMSTALSPLNPSMLPPPLSPSSSSVSSSSSSSSSASSASSSGQTSPQGSSSQPSSPSQSASFQSNSLAVSQMTGQPPISTFDAKYGLLPGPANFVDSTVTFDHRYGWVPRYPNYVLPPGANYFPATGHPYSFPSHKVARGAAEIRGSDNKITGTINFEQEENEHVTIRGKILGLTPGAHGMHILEKPLNGNDCSSGGDHYNPQKTEHGGKHDWVRHVGDLGNIFADRDGIAYFDLTDQIISLSGGYSIFNRTIVITEKPDDLGRSGDPESKRTGNSGPAIACGLIQLSKF